MKTFKIMDLYFSAAPGPSDWYIKWERCGGNRQSPINIDTTRVRERKYRTLKIEFDNSGGLVAGDLENNGNYPTFSVDKSKGTARLKGSRLTDTYVLKGFHVHFGCENDRGSEHTRNGRRYSGEVIRCYTRFLSFPKGNFFWFFCFASSLKSHEKFTFWFVERTRGLSFSPNAQFRSLLKFQYSSAELLLSFQVHFLFEDPSGRYAVVAFWLRVKTDHHMIYI